MTDERQRGINHASPGAMRKSVEKSGRKKERERRRREELDFAYPLVTSFHQRLIQKRGAIETMSMLDQHRLTACLISRFH